MQLGAMLLALMAFLALDAPVWLANGMFVALALVGLGLVVYLESHG
jgi:hypothetical protein